SGPGGRSTASEDQRLDRINSLKIIEWPDLIKTSIQPTYHHLRNTEALLWKINGYFKTLVLINVPTAMDTGEWISLTNLTTHLLIFGVLCDAFG
ncbi:MAG: hypothetical protein WDZ80_07025, partial [Candidatus Paceibacterota bacterium]